MNGEAFAKYCGPRALAALADINPGHAADLLLRIQYRRGRINAPSATVSEMLLALLERGFAVIEYASARNVGCVPLTPHAELEADVIGQQVQLEESFAATHITTGRLPEILELPQPVSEQTERAVSTAIARIEGQTLLTVAEVAEQIGPGRWLVCAGCAPGAAIVRHFVALEDRICIAGDEPGLPTYGAAAVHGLYQVVKRGTRA